MLPSRDLRADQRTYEILLSTEYKKSNFREVQNLVARIKAKKVPSTFSMCFVAVKAALKANSF